MKRLFLILAAMLALASVPATAQNNWLTPGGSGASGGVGMCLNAAGLAIPVGPQCNGSAPAAPALPTTSVVESASGTTGAVAATMPATAGVTNYLCHVDVSALGGTASVGPITTTGLLNAQFKWNLASTATGNDLSLTFTPCLPASAVNTAIAVTTTADATATAVTVNLSGFQQ